MQNLRNIIPGGKKKKKKNKNNKIPNYSYSKNSNKKGYLLPVNNEKVSRNIVEKFKKYYT